MMQDHARPAADSMLATAWITVRSQLRDHDALQCRVALQLLERVQIAGDELFKLQYLYESRTDAFFRRDYAAQLLNFVDGDLTDVFRGFTGRIAALIALTMGEAVEVDPLEIDADLDLVLRYLDVSVMAADSSSIPSSYRAVFQEVAGALRTWGSEVRALVAELTAQAQSNEREATSSGRVG